MTIWRHPLLIGLVVAALLLIFRPQPLATNGANLLIAQQHWANKGVPATELETTSSLQARLLARQDLEHAERWLLAGPIDQASTLNQFQLCNLYWTKNDLANAIAACQAGKVPADYWIRAGLQAEQADNPAAALAAYEMATAIDPIASLAWYRLGHILFQQKNFQAAILAHEQALDHGYNSNSGVYEELGRAHLQLENLSQAETVFQTGLAQFPDSLPLHYDMVTVARQERDWAKAESWLGQLLALWPEEVRAWLLRGDAALQQNDAHNARSYYEQAATLEPDNLSAWAGSARAAIQMDDVESARQAFAQLLALNPKQSGFWQQAADFYYQQEDWTEAAAAYSHLLTVDPTNQQAQTRLAEIKANE